MDNHYCPVCGEHHGGAAEAEVQAVELAELTSAEVEIARINADKEIRLARIQAGMMESEAIAEAVIGAAHAEGEAAGLREAMAPPEPVTAPSEPVVVVQDVDTVEPEVQAPAPVDHDEEPPKSKSRGLGAW